MNTKFKIPGFLLCCAICMMMLSCKKQVMPDKNNASLKFLGGAANDEIVFITEYPDGGWLLFGNTKSKGHGGYDIYEAHIDANLNLVSDATYGGAFNDGITAAFVYGRASAKSIFTDKEGNILIGGYTEQLRKDVTDSAVAAFGIVYKFDKYGKLLHSVVIPDAAAVDMSIYGISQLPSGNYLVFGHAFSTDYAYTYELTPDLVPAGNHFSGDIPLPINQNVGDFALRQNTLVMVPGTALYADNKMAVQYYTFSGGTLVLERDTIDCPGVKKPYFGINILVGLYVAGKNNFIAAFYDYDTTATPVTGSAFVKITAGKMDWVVRNQFVVGGQTGTIETDQEGNCYSYGYVGSNTTTGKSAYGIISKISLAGKILWTKDIAIPFANQLTALHVNKDKSLILSFSSGFALGNFRDATIIQLDNNGNLILSK